MKKNNVRTTIQIREYFDLDEKKIFFHSIVRATAIRISLSLSLSHYAVKRWARPTFLLICRHNNNNSNNSNNNKSDTDDDDDNEDDNGGRSHRATK